jgi:hypothetical protein
LLARRAGGAVKIITPRFWVVSFEKACGLGLLEVHRCF